jgi:hypothetical protein
MRKFIITGMAVAMLAVPAAASASQPVNPGGFGQERAANIHKYFTNDGLGSWGNPNDAAAAIGVDGASDRKGDNSLNTTYMRAYDQSLPVESHAGL